jgi:hypothetical protein
LAQYTNFSPIKITWIKNKKNLLDGLPVLSGVDITVNPKFFPNPKSKIVRQFSPKFRMFSGFPPDYWSDMRLSVPILDFRFWILD